MSIHFPILRSKRLTIQLKELSIGTSVELAKIPGHLEQTAVSAFLHAAVADSSHPDVGDWTVAERTLAICHYLSSVLDDGPDFGIGDGKYTDYLDGSRDIVTLEVHDLGEMEGDFWQIRHLNGYAAEAIERLHGELPNISGRLHWIIGAMAAQLLRKGEELPAKIEEDWLLERMLIFAQYPESDFIKLSFLYQAGTEKLHHLFRIGFDDKGVLVLPATDGDKEEAELPPARFLVRSLLSGFAQRMGGEPGEPGG